MGNNLAPSRQGTRQNPFTSGGSGLLESAYYLSLAIFVAGLRLVLDARVAFSNLKAGNPGLRTAEAD